MCSMGIEHISGLHKAGTSVWVRRAPWALWSVVRPNCSERKEDTTVQTPDSIHKFWRSWQYWSRYWPGRRTGEVRVSYRSILQARNSHHNLFFPQGTQRKKTVPACPRCQGSWMDLIGSERPKSNPVVMLWQGHCALEKVEISLLFHFL